MTDLGFIFTKIKFEKLPIPSDNSVTYHDKNNCWLQNLAQKTFVTFEKLMGGCLGLLWLSFLGIIIEQARSSNWSHLCNLYRKLSNCNEGCL